MRSFLRPVFTFAALLLTLVMVGAAVLWVIERHLEKHRHCFAYAPLSVERAERGEGQADGEGQDVVHGCSVPQGGSSNHVRSAAP
jgi:hypothetical protein